jgi:hypothetical protein
MNLLIVSSRLRSFASLFFFLAIALAFCPSVLACLWHLPFPIPSNLVA